MYGSEIDKIVYTKLVNLGFTIENTIFADSSCPDEINHDNPDEDLTSLMHARWGEHFSLGGLAGIPFTGKAGWATFSSHAPQDGNVLVMFAPHIGIDRKGNVG